MSSDEPFVFPKGKIKYLRRLFVYLQPYKLHIVGVFISLIISSSAVLSLGVGIRFLVDEGFGKENPAFLDQSLLILFGIILILAISTYARFFLVTRLGEQVVADLRRDIYRHLLNLSPSFFEISKPGTIMSRMTTDTTVLQVVVGSSLSIAMRNILLLIGGVTLLIITSPKLAGYIAILIPLVVLPVLLLGKKVRKLSRRSQEKIAALAAKVEETLNGIRTIQAYTREPLEVQRFEDRVDDALSAAMDRVKMRALLTATVILFSFGSVSFVLWLGGQGVIIGELSAGELSSFLFLSVIVAGAFGALSEVIGDVQRAGGAAEALLELLDASSDITEPKTPVTLGNVKTAIVFDNISFSYPTRPDINALNHFSLTIEPGQTIALVGPSGAGKSTVFQLLLRFYDPQEGTIRLGDVGIEQLSLVELREQFAYVSQEPMIFSASAYENIAYGITGASEEAIIHAAKAARAYDFIEKLPEGFDTYLGVKGVRLSGGERQRIAMARAILRNPQILLLDEATSALDAENELLVQEALEQLMEQRTTLVIAHRLATVQKADRIIVLNEGKIEAQGTHESLLKDSKLYIRLAELQFVV